LSDREENTNIFFREGHAENVEAAFGTSDYRAGDLFARHTGPVREIANAFFLHRTQEAAVQQMVLSIL